MLLPTVMLDLTTTNSTVMECFRLTLSNAVITSVENNYDMTSSLSETLGLNFGQLSWNIAQFNTQNGLPNNYASTLFTNSGNPINGQSPIFLSGNFTNAGVFVANGIRNTNLIQLTWNAIAGKNYCIYAVSRLNQPFLAVGQISATFTGQTNASCGESVDRFCEERLIK